MSNLRAQHSALSEAQTTDPFLVILLIQEELLSFTSKSMCTEYWLTA